MDGSKYVRRISCLNDEEIEKVTRTTTTIDSEWNIFDILPPRAGEYDPPWTQDELDEDIRFNSKIFNYLAFYGLSGWNFTGFEQEMDGYFEEDE